MQRRGGAGHISIFGIRFLAEQVRAGHYKDASDLVNDVIRSLRDQQQAPFDITPELESWLLEAAASPTTPLVRKDFESIRERVKNRIGPKTS